MDIPLPEPAPKYLQIRNVWSSFVDHDTYGDKTYSVIGDVRISHSNVASYEKGSYSLSGLPKPPGTNYGEAQPDATLDEKTLSDFTLSSNLAINGYGILPIPLAEGYSFGAASKSRGTDYFSNKYTFTLNTGTLNNTNFETKCYDSATNEIIEWRDLYVSLSNCVPINVGYNLNTPSRTYLVGSDMYSIAGEFTNKMNFVKNRGSTVFTLSEPVSEVIYTIRLLGGEEGGYDYLSNNAGLLIAATSDSKLLIQL